MATADEITAAYESTLAQLTSIVSSPDSKPAVANAADRARAALNLARMAQIRADYASRTAALNFLIERLNHISSSVTVSLADELKQRLGQAITTAQNQLLTTMAEGLGNVNAIIANAAAVTPDTAALQEGPPAQADRPPDATDVLPAAPLPRPDANVPDAFVSSKASAVAQPLQADYEKLFATCAIRGDRLPTVNWYLQKLIAGRERYETVAQPFQIPWWFIGIVHGLETGFDFKRHLHNGDPLSAKTVRVPKGRPDGNPPFEWDASAADAIRWEELDQWHDWTVPGVLYKWEKYNGFGYRNKHPEVLSPYLWSFTNHYTSGKYVQDGVFDSTAVSKQCGAAAMLRSLVNKGTVSFG